jgi:hypothetical protein
MRGAFAQNAKQAEGNSELIHASAGGFLVCIWSCGLELDHFNRKWPDDFRRGVKAGIAG